MITEFYFLTKSSTMELSVKKVTKIKYILFFLLILTFLVSCKIQKREKSIYGKVASIESFTYTYDEDEEVFFSHTKVLFNQKGLPLEENKFNTDDGSLRSKGNFVFDKSGNIEFERSKGASKLTSPSYMYDENGNFSKIIYDYEDEKSEVIFTYDEQQNKISRSVLSEGVLKEKAIWEYDKYGNQTKRDLYKYLSNGDFDTKLTLKYEYDRKGRITGNYRFSNDTVISYKSLFEYKKRGKEKIAFIYLHGKDFSNKEVTVYNKKNNIKAEKKYRNGKIDYQITYTYKYDEKGNWIERKRYYNERLAGLKKRTFTYYEG